MQNRASLANIERSYLRKNGDIKKIKKGQHRIYHCNLCETGREYDKRGILLYIRRTHKSIYQVIKNKSLEAF